MSILKQRYQTAKAFKFGELIPQADNVIINADSFELKSLASADQFKNNITAEIIRSEREHEAATSFRIDDKVKHHRGLIRQAEEDYQQTIETEVAKRLKEINDKAYQIGYEQGLKIGEEKAYNDAMEMYNERSDEFTNYIGHVKSEVDIIYHKAKEDAYSMVKNLSKWVILKEVDEKYYLSRLLEKLIHEINEKTNLVIHVNEAAFGYMPEIVKVVERKVGKLNNVRMEVDLDMQENGIKLETENTIIDASLEAQFKSIDRLFKRVGLNE